MVHSAHVSFGYLTKLMPSKHKHQFVQKKMITKQGRLIYQLMLFTMYTW